MRLLHGHKIKYKPEGNKKLSLIHAKRTREGRKGMAEMKLTTLYLIYFGLAVSFTWNGSSIKAFPLLGTTTGCGGILKNATGTIISPRYPEKYPANTVCVWVINNDDANSTIEMNFESFSLEDHLRCRYDYVLVRDGDSSSSPFIGKFCGSTIPKTINSKGNSLWVRFYSDSVVNGNGFKVSYAKKEPNSKERQMITKKPEDHCGGNLSGSSGEINSPGFPHRYPNKKKCTWFIENNNAQDIIEVTFLALRIEFTPQCLFDHVTIQDVSTENTRLIGRFCGKTLPTSTFSGQKLRILFQSDESGVEAGFKLKWTTKSISQQPACGYIKKSAVGFLRSTNFPENYKNNEKCNWKISAPDFSMKIQLRFANFDTEYSPDCIYDYIEVYDGDSQVAPRIGRFCGNIVPELINSTQQHMLIIFRSDGTDTKSGFEASWLAVFNSVAHRNADLGSENRIIDSEKGKRSSSCGGILTASNGTISTPNYPKKYPSSTICTWIIKADEKHHVKLKFETFDIEKHLSCAYDKVVVRDGANVASKLIGEYCEDVAPKEIISIGDSLWIQFKSDDSKELTGFQAAWRFIRKSGNIACGTKFRSNSGELSSPGYPLPDKTKKHCSWSIEVPKNMKIRIIFNDIDLAESAGCAVSYVQVSDGISSQYPELGRFCRTFLPRPIISSTNKLFIGFQPNGNTTVRGFKLEWEAIAEKRSPTQQKTLPDTECNSTLSEESGNIVLKARKRSCSWLIKPASGKRVTLTVVKANIIPNQKCDLERLFIHNGYTTLAPVLLKICGHPQTRSVTSLTGVLRVHYEDYHNATEKEIHLFWTTAVNQLLTNPLQETCGRVQVDRPSSFHNEVIVVQPGVLPWMAALVAGSTMVICGATIISSHWLLTAAHCLRRYPVQEFGKVHIGELDLFKDDGSEQIFDINLMHVHPEYNSTTKENDIALIKIEGEIALGEKVNTICLPGNETAFRVGTICTVAGWGTRSFLGKPSQPLVQAQIPLVSKQICNSTLSYKGQIKHEMMCAGNSYGGIDTCQGDGGGPLICEAEKGKQEIVGIASWGNGCGLPNKYGVYTKVNRYLDWIYSIIES